MSISILFQHHKFFITSHLLLYSFCPLLQTIFEIKSHILLLNHHPGTIIGLNYNKINHQNFKPDALPFSQNISSNPDSHPFLSHFDNNTKRQKFLHHTRYSYFCLLIFSLSMLMKIFLSRSHPAPDMPLRFIHVQHLARLPGKGRIDLEKPFGNVWWCQAGNKKNCISFDCLRN